MSWNIHSEPLKSDIIQTNTPVYRRPRNYRAWPEYQKILKEKKLELLTGNPLKNKPKFEDFMTPGTMRSKPTVKESFASKQENVYLEGLLNDVETQQDVVESNSAEFATPRMHHSKSKHKVKVIHKEKLKVKPFSVNSTGNINAAVRSESVPTAHVTPSLSTRSPSRLTEDICRPYAPAFGTGACTEKHDWAEPGRGRSHTPTTDVSISRPLSSRDRDKFQGIDSTRRWNSSQNIDSEAKDEFLALPHDHTFVEHSRHVREAEDVDLHHHGNRYRDNKHIGLSDAATGDIGLVDSMNHYNYPASVTSQDYYTRKDSFRIGPHSGSIPYSGTSSGLYDRPLSTHSPYSGIASGPYHTSVPTTTSLYGQEYSYTQPVASYSQVGIPPSVCGEHLNSDITHWQQRHQEQLRRQHYEATQTLPAYRSVTPATSNYSQSTVSSILLRDPHKLDAVKKAADDIIREKDNIIDKQKMKIVQLERQSKDTGVEMHKNLLKKVQQEGEGMHMKMQELQYENATLKAQLTESLGNKSTDLHTLEKKLGKSEYELQEFKHAMDRELATKNEELWQLKQKMSKKETEVVEWREKHSSLKEEHNDLERKMDGLERYLGDIPTTDEKAKQLMEVKSVKEERQRYKARVAELEKKLSEAGKGLRSRDGLVESLEAQEKELRDQLDSFKEQNDKLSADLKRLRDGDTEDVEEIKYENDRLRSDCEKAKKLLEGKQKRLEQMECHQRGRIEELERQLGQEEAMVAGLKQELSAKDQHLKKLRASVKELNTTNQDLMEKGMMLDDHVKQLERQCTGDTHKLERRLLREMGICFTELQALVQICVQRAEGQDPNLSVLLGVRASTSEVTGLEDQSSDTVQALKHKVTKIRELRQDIDKLRELISNKYAEDMGENLNCTTQ